MLYIAEYIDIGQTTRGSIAIPLEPPVGEQAIEAGPNSVQSAAFKADTCIVRLSADEDCMIDIGGNPDATNSVRKLIAGKGQIITVPMGKGFKVAVVAAQSGSVTGMDGLESLLKLVASPADAAKQFATLQDNTAKMTAAAADLRSAGTEDRKMKDDLAKATQDALDAKGVADKAMAAVAAREAAFDKDAQDHADKVKADLAEVDARSKALDDRVTAAAEVAAVLNKRGTDLADLAANLEARSVELDAREASMTAAQADYEARIAKLKALTA